MDDFYSNHQGDWKGTLEQLSRIRSLEEYSIGNVDLIRSELSSEDDRIRGAATLAAEGCLFEPYILALMTEIAEYDPTPAIRKAAIRSLGIVIQEGVEQNMEDDSGADTQLDDAEEWEEYQSGSLRDDYLRVKSLLFGFLEFEDDSDIQALAATALADLGYMNELRYKISELYDSGDFSAKLSAITAMGKFPHFWEDLLLENITPDTPGELLKTAISSSYASNSSKLAIAIESILNHDDPEVLRYALLTLSNINQSRNLADILQQFSLHDDESVQKAARDSIDMHVHRNFDQYLRGDLGMGG